MSYKLQDFTRIEKIGEGTYGVVYKCRNKITNELAALKKIRSENNEDGVSPTTLREISMLKELTSPYIVRLHQTISDKGNLYLVFEYLNMDLRRYLDSCDSLINGSILKRFTYQIMQGLLYCHCRRIMHRDLKPQNLLVDTDNHIIKLADFGLARAYGVPVKPLTHEVVTLWYRAPEILLNSKRYSCAIDVWSVGCIFAEMATSKPIFQGDSEIDQLFCIFKILGTPDEKDWTDLQKLPGWNPMFPIWHPRLQKHLEGMLDNLGLDLLERLLTYQPSNRINIRDALCHDYFLNLDKSDLPGVDEEKLSCPKEIFDFYKIALEKSNEGLSDLSNVYCKN